MTTETATQLFAVQDYNATRTLLLAPATEGLDALDAFTEQEHGGRLSTWIEEQPDDWGWDVGNLYTTPQGFICALLGDREIVAVPVTPPLAVRLARLGWSVVDARGVVLAVRHRTADEARAAVPGAPASVWEAS